MVSKIVHFRLVFQIMICEEYGSIAHKQHVPTHPGIEVWIEPASA